jgi:hypothetical protein
MIAITSLYNVFVVIYGLFEIILFGSSSYLPIVIKIYNFSCTMNYADEQGCTPLVVKLPHLLGYLK